MNSSLAAQMLDHAARIMPARRRLWLQAMRADGSGPRFRRHSRSVRYHIDDLDAWSKGASATGAGNA